MPPNWHCSRRTSRTSAATATCPGANSLTRPTVWLLCAQYFCLSYGWYFYVTWLPTYLKDVRGMELKSNAVMKWLADLLEGSLSPEMTLKILAAALAGIPLLFGGFGSLIAGVIASRLIARTGRVTLVRRTFGFVGLTGAATLLMTSFYIKDPLLAMLSMGMASFFNDTTCRAVGRPAWTSAANIAGTVSGSMNMMGNFGGMAGPIVVGYVLDRPITQTGSSPSLIFAVIYFLGAICWLFIDPVTPLETAKRLHSRPERAMSRRDHSGDYAG